VLAAELAKADVPSLSVRTELPARFNTRLRELCRVRSLFYIDDFTPFADANGETDTRCYVATAAAITTSITRPRARRWSRSSAIICGELRIDRPGAAPHTPRLSCPLPRGPQAVGPTGKENGDEARSRQ